MEEIFFPKRSYLYSIEPRGLKTEYIESLTSYITRLSEAHSVYTGTLLNTVLAQNLNKQYISKYAVNGGNGFLDSAHALNGTNKNAADFAGVISALTCRNDIQYMTMTTLRDVIPTKGLLKGSLSWCPECYEELRKSGLPIFSPLLWNFQVTEICEKHGTRLASVCPNCNSKIPYLHRKGCIGFCPKCNAWLGDSPKDNNNDKSGVDIKYQSWVNSNIGELLRLAPTLNCFPKRENLTNNINYLIYSTCNGIVDFGKFTGFSKATVSDWSSGKSIPTLNKLLFIGYKFGVMLKDLLINADNISKTSRLIGADPSFVYENKHIGRKKLCYDQVREELEKYIRKDKNIPMTQVAQKIGINKRVLYRIFPDLCKQISKNHKHSLENSRIERSQKVKQEIDYTIENLLENGQYPGRRKIEMNLSNKIILREKVAKEAWKSKLGMNSLGK